MKLRDPQAPALPAPWADVSATQKGAVGEHLIAAWLMIASNGRLSPFKSIADDGGVDLLVLDKHTGAAVPLQIKTRSKTLRRNPHAAHFEVRLATFRAGLDSCLLAVSFEPTEFGANFRCAWLIPMRQLESVASKRETKLVIRPSGAAGTKDRYAPYQCKSIHDVSSRIIQICEQRSAKPR